MKNIAVFGTYGGQMNALFKMKETLRNHGLNVLDETFGCKGKAWVVLNRSHPSNDDLIAAREFAQKVIKKIDNL